MPNKSVTGIIERISEKEWSDPRSGEDITLYSFALEGEKGWYRTGTTPPPYTEGTAVRFVVDTRKGNVELDSIEEVEGTEVTRAPRANANFSKNSPRKFPPKSNASSGSSRDDYWKDKDKYYREVEVPRITLSACQSRAIEVVKMALANEAVNLGATKGKRLDNLLSVIDEVTDRFIDQIENIGKSPAKKAEAKARTADEPFDDDIPFGDEGDNAGWDD